MTKITAQPGIMEIALYQGGASHVAGVTNVVKLSSNENPFGPSPKAIEAFRAAGADLHRYPNTDHGPLRRAIGTHHGLDPERIICGVGSDEIITFLCQCFAGPGDEVLYTEHGFSMYKISARAAGAEPVKVPERDRMVDIDAVIAGVTARTRLVFVTNPGNPTSTMLGEADLERLVSAVPEHVIVVLDGAYAEFAAGFDGGASLVDRHANLVMTRTFSKLYGLGGLRVGWGYASPEIIGVLNRVRGPFNLSEPQMAAAIAALEDTDYTAFCLSENTRLRAMLAEGLAELGVPSDTSCTNFVLARFASEAEANACDDMLKSDGILVRRVGGYGLPDCLRITVGDEASCRRVIESVRAFKAGAE